MVGEAERAHARGADLVDRLRGDLLRDAALDLGLARGDLALAGLQDLAEDDLLDLLGRRRRSAPARPRSRCRRGRWRRARRGAPPILPTGVRAVPRITELGICCLSSASWSGSVERVPIPGTAGRYRDAARAVRMHRLAPDEGRSRDSELREADADLLVVGLYEGDSLPAALAEAPGAAAAKGTFKTLSAVFAGGRRRRSSSSGSASARTLDAERLRVAAALVAKEAASARGDARWPGRCRSSGIEPQRRRGDRHRHVLGAYRFDRFRAADPDEPAPAIESLTLLGPAEAAEAAEAARRRTPRPRTAPATCRAPPPTSPPRPSSPSAPRRSPPAPTRSAVEVLGREEIAREGDGRPRSPSPRAAPRSRA